jgi:UDP-glucose:(glucosyl)LPS alpha-1,2-glucosyltransferase
MIEFDDFSKLAMGGTEIIKHGLQNRLPQELLSKFQIICDRIITIDDTKIRLFWAHNTFNQVDYTHLKDDGWKKFHKMIFISHHQMEEFVREYHIPYSHCVIMKHALEPVKSQKKPTNKISLIYTSIPHRGLDILVNVFEKLCEEYDNIELKVHSSYKIYGLKDNQLKYEKMHLYQRLEEHPNIKNIGYVSNDELKKSLASSHIFSYPSTYRETFCLALLEAMSAGLLCVHPNYACLPETASNWTMMYDYHENKEVHEEIFYEHLKKAIDNVNDRKVQRKLKYQSKYVNHFYNWETRTQEWIDLLKSLEHLSPKIPKNISFSYS